VVSRRNADIADTMHLRDVACICVKSAVKPHSANQPTSLRCRVLAISAFRRLTTQTPLHNQLSSRYRSHKASYSKLRPKIGCHSNVPQPHLTRFPGPIRAHNPNGILISSAVFAQMTAECIYTLQWDVLPPSKLPFPWGIWTPSNTRLLWPPESSTQMASRSVHPFLQGSVL